MVRSLMFTMRTEIMV